MDDTVIGQQVEATVTVTVVSVPIPDNMKTLHPRPAGFFQRQDLCTWRPHRCTLKGKRFARCRTKTKLRRGIAVSATRRGRQRVSWRSSFTARPRGVR